jgi:hypothetical protein
MIRLKAFRAIDDEQSCLEFARGHAAVLEGFDLGNISTNNTEWAYNPLVYVIMAYDDDNKLLGGIRIQIAGGGIPLPVEEAVAHFDPKVIDLVKKYADNGGTSELCGLWNSRSVAPKFGVTINLVIAGMALCSQLPITSIFTIVASYTLKIALRMGFQIEKQVGNNGEFIYPNSNFIARVLSMNPRTLEHTYGMFKSKILDLRNNPNFIRQEFLDDGSVLEYAHELSLERVHESSSIK